MKFEILKFFPDMSVLSLERDIYPAFTSGEVDKIIVAQGRLTQAVSQSTHDADSIFRSFNWSWPTLTASARSNGPQGIAIIENFAMLMTALLCGCSPALCPAIASCKALIRILFRELSNMNPSVVIPFLNAISEHVITAKDIRQAKGYFLEKSAVEQLIILAAGTENEELSTIADDLVENVLRHKKLFTPDFVVEFFVKLVKSKNASAECAMMVRSVLEARKSKELYDSLMERLTFLSISGEGTLLKKIRTLNFFIVVLSADCPGTALPGSVTKSELTVSIISVEQNRLISLFSLKMFGAILSRFPTNFEGQQTSSVRDKLVEVSSLLPLLKLLIADDSSSSVLLLLELSRVILAWKRSFPGSFVECKFNWSKLLSESIPDDRNLKIVLRLVFRLVAHSVPITSHVSAVILKLVATADERPVLSDYCWALIGQYFSKHVGLGLFDSTEEAMVTISLVRKQGDAKSFFSQLFALLIDSPANVEIPVGKSCVAAAMHVMKLEGLIEKIERKTQKKRRRICEEGESPATEIDVQFVDPFECSSSHQLPRVSYKKRYLCPPLPDVEVDPFDPALGGWATLMLANELDSDSPSVNLIDLVGQRVNFLYASIVSLSAQNTTVRQSAYDVLAVILRAVAMTIESRGFESGRFAFREAPQVAMVLTWLRNGIEAPTEGEGVPKPISRISACFVVEILKVMFDPKSPVYSVVYKLVLAKASLRISDLSGWTALYFNSDGANFAALRAWILHVVKLGAGDLPSIDIMARRGIIQALLESAINLNGSVDELDAVLSIVLLVTKTLASAKPIEEEGSALVSFVQKYGLAHWLSNMSRNLRLDDS